MGRLHFHDVQAWINTYELSAFVETGLERGTSLRHAQSFSSFQKLVSIDINEKWINAARKKGVHKDPRVTLLHGNSFDVLPEALDIVQGHRVLWWLDAHFPEKYSSERLDAGRSFTGASPEDFAKMFPVKREIEVVVHGRDVSLDLFLMDDLRIYEVGEYDGGNWKRRHLYDNPGNSDFVEDLLGKTHNIARSGKESGYIIATPK